MLKINYKWVIKPVPDAKEKVPNQSVHEEGPVVSETMEQLGEVAPTDSFCGAPLWALNKVQEAKSCFTSQGDKFKYWWYIVLNINCCINPK